MSDFCAKILQDASSERKMIFSFIRMFLVFNTHKYKIEISNMNENYQFIKFKIKNKTVWNTACTPNSFFQELLIFSFFLEINQQPDECN